MLHYITLHNITLYYITLHYMVFHYIALHCITLHYIALLHQFISSSNNCISTRTASIPSGSRVGPTSVCKCDNAFKRSMDVCKYATMITKCIIYVMMSLG